MKSLRVDKLWFSLTDQEKLILGVFLLIMATGLAVKYFVLKEQEPEPYRPEKVERIEYL